MYGRIDSEYVGITKDEQIKKDEYPEIEASYNPDTKKITAKASIKKGNIEKIETIYKEQIIEELTIQNPGNGKQIELGIQNGKQGQYKIKATADNGNVAYAYVYVSNIDPKLEVPKITIKEEAQKNGGWYNTKVTVTIETTEQNIKYRLVTGTAVVKAAEQTENAEIAGIPYQGEFEIDTQGLTTIYAWVEKQTENRNI